MNGRNTMRYSRSSSLRLENGDRHKTEKKLVKFEGRLMRYESLPEYLKDNEFIRDHYRCEWPLKHTILSIFSLHNETLNIWTHLVGLMIFLGLTVMSLPLENALVNLLGEGTDGRLMTKMMDNSSGAYTFFSDSLAMYIPKPSILHVYKGSDLIPKWPWFVFLGGAMSCLIFSTISHLFACHSQRFYFFFWRLDYTGISLMIVCSFFAPIYYAFSSEPFWRLLYLTSITLVGILVVITLLAPVFSTARFRSFRVNLFLSMGFSGVIPATHAVILYWDQPQIAVALGYEIAMGILYAAGAVFYMTRIPERWKPGAFDIVGQSHQIFHLFVVAAALAHSAATLVVMEWRLGLPT